MIFNTFKEMINNIAKIPIIKMKSLFIANDKNTLLFEKTQNKKRIKKDQ